MTAYGIQSVKTFKTLHELINWGANQFNQHQLFFGHGVDNATDDAAFLAAHALDLAPLIPESRLNQGVSNAERDAIVALYQQRIRTRKPTGIPGLPDIKFL